MPTKTVTIYTCSVCEEDQDPGATMHSMKLSANGSGTLHYDICDWCHANDENVRAFMGFGEKRGARGKPVQAQRAVRAREKRAPKENMVTVKALKKCDDCDYTHERANVVANHARREHGRISPRAKAKVSV